MTGCSGFFVLCVVFHNFCKRKKRSRKFPSWVSAFIFYENEMGHARLRIQNVGVAPGFFTKMNNTEYRLKGMNEIKKKTSSVIEYNSNGKLLEA